MAKKKQQEDEVLVDVGGSISKAERFFEENGKALTGVALAIFVIVAGYFAYTRLYLKPLEQEAQRAIFEAQQLFEADSLEQAVNGAGSRMGFLEIADEYSNTKAGNLANYYAGVSYLQMGQYENAIRLLDEFNTDDPILSVMAVGTIGDAFMELGQTEEALEYYDQASRESDNALVVPYYLQKAGLVAEMQGEFDAAKDYFERIKSDFSDSKQGADIEKYIARVEAKL